MNIRRFDVFAVNNYLLNLQKGLDEAHAKGDAIWLAKVVASGFRKKPASFEPKEKPPPTEFKSLSGQKQTGETYDREIVKRLGELYPKVLEAVKAELEKGRKYVQFRDEICAAFK